MLEFNIYPAQQSDKNKGTTRWHLAYQEAQKRVFLTLIAVIAQTNNFESKKSNTTFFMIRLFFPAIISEVDSKHNFRVLSTPPGSFQELNTT